MLPSDVNNTGFTGAYDPDSVMYVRFYMKSIQNMYETEKQGRSIFFDVPFVEIMIPGNQLSIVDTPVREPHKKRFPKQWMVFQNSQSADQVSGTRVEEWPAITRSQAEELKGLKFFTVEQIAGASDEQIQRLGMNATMLRQKAKAFLGQAKDTALAQSQAAELQKRDQEITDLKNMVNRLASQIEQINKPVEAPPVEEQKKIKEVPMYSTKRKYTRRPVQETKGPDA